MEDPPKRELLQVESKARRLSSSSSSEEELSAPPMSKSRPVVSISCSPGPVREAFFSAEIRFGARRGLLCSFHLKGTKGFWATWHLTVGALLPVPRATR